MITAQHKSSRMIFYVKWATNVRSPGQSCSLLLSSHQLGDSPRDRFTTIDSTAKREALTRGVFPVFP